jgi:hypothetical protein
LRYSFPKTTKGEEKVLPERMPLESGTPPYNDAFIETLVQKLTPPVSRQVSGIRTRLVGMSLALALASLVAIGFVTYLFLSMGVAGIGATGIQLGSSLSPVQQLFGISLTSLAIVLVNVVFHVIVLRERR